MRILTLLSSLMSCQMVEEEPCHLPPTNYNAMVFLERTQENYDCPTDVLLYAKTTVNGGLLNADEPRAQTHTFLADECKTTGVSYLDGVDLRTMEKLNDVKIAYTIYWNEPPHGLVVARVSELCTDGEYCVYVGVRP